jgi:hypothetical protein
MAIDVEVSNRSITKITKVRPDLAQPIVVQPDSAQPEQFESEQPKVVQPDSPLPGSAQGYLTDILTSSGTLTPEASRRLKAMNELMDEAEARARVRAHRGLFSNNLSPQGDIVVFPEAG